MTHEAAGRNEALLIFNIYMDSSMCIQFICKYTCYKVACSKLLVDGV